MQRANDVDWVMKSPWAGASRIALISNHCQQQ
jgi:hypothetical protein